MGEPSSENRDSFSELRRDAKSSIQCKAANVPTSIVDNYLNKKNITNETDGEDSRKKRRKVEMKKKIVNMIEISDSEDERLVVTIMSRTLLIPALL